MRNLLNLQRSSFMQPDLLCSRQPKIFSINHALVPLTLLPLLCLLKCSVTFVTAIPGTDSIHTTTHQKTLHLNYGLSNSLNMLIFLLPSSWSCPQEIDFYLTAIHLWNVALYKPLYLLCWWSFFVLFVCPDIFLHDKKFICQMAISLVPVKAATLF